MESRATSVGDVIEIEVDRIAYGGDAVGRYNGLTVFVPFAAPGDRLRVRITERKKTFARATIESVTTASLERRDPPCRYFGDCGGCQLQHLTYRAQLAAKEGFVRDALARIGGIHWPHEIKMHHADEWGYRRRAQIKVARASSRPSDVWIGYYRTGSHSVCDIESCPILAPELNEALATIRATLTGAADVRVAAVDEIRMVAGDSEVACAPEMPGLPSAPIKQTVLGASYLVSPEAFFQVNRFLIDELAAEAVGEHEGPVALDLFAGVGLFSVHLARRFRRVIAVESDAEAAALGRDNVSENGAANVEFCCTRVEAWLEEAARQEALAPVDLVLLDPPRAGAADALNGIVALRPKNLIYVSCDPATLARDLRQLLDCGFALQKVAAFDLFPQTYHVETIASLAAV